MDFQKLRKQVGDELLSAAYAAGYLKLKTVNAKTPTEPARDFPMDLRHHYPLNVDQGSVTTTGNPPGGVNIGAVVELIRDVTWPDHLAIQSAVSWFKRIVLECDGVRPYPRDEFARQAAEKFAISQRCFLEIVWGPNAPETWKQPGAPSRR